ncbi:lipopolysaccharide biosynthesis protein [Quadrisphaera sp. DSM 44207]|uniref:lipopolysaccharide biosynthesis protein n=1 Tax=Quadrisphaera sp. DSM 44207 TaxID=1881057 RepID=UPI00088F81AA|nr:oligosaccharide flippase family protein [Quadrisphaera sp. DSM 44207]SDQ10351.1 Membrane protein involved in the export of O-antigen and teichoic acid [Quadrisphaera sp. DSM 44207]
MSPPPTSVLTRAGALRRSPFARGVGAMLLGHAGRAVLQGLSFLVLARALGADGFGAVSAVLAVVALAVPFASLGAVHLLVRAVVREPQRAAAEFAGAAAVTAGGGALATAVVTAAAAWLLPARVPVLVIAAVAVADLVGSLLLELAGGVCTARGRMLRTAAFQLAFHGLRLAAALLLLAGPLASPLTTWALAHAAASLLAALAVVALVRRDLGPARADARRYLRQWRDGLLFSCGLASQAVYNDLDKAMLARLSTLEATGVYTAAYRVVDMALTPLRALLATAYPRFFAEGAAGLAGSLRVARRLAVPALGWCALASLALLLGADLVPVLLGESYAASVGALRALAVLPLLKAAHHLAADALTGAGHQGVRTAWQAGVAVGNALLNLALIPSLGVAGAVVSSLVCDGVLAVALWCVVVTRRHSTPSAPARRSAASPPGG